MLKGIAVSEGIGIGKVILAEEQPLEYIEKTVTDKETEINRLEAAVSDFCEKTKKQAEELAISVGKNEADILLGHISIVHDPFLMGEAEKLIKNGKCAEGAFAEICDMFITVFSSSEDEMTKQRSVDVRDVKNGVLRILLGINEIKLSDVPKGSVIVAKELTPSMTAGINKDHIAGIITETGGMTSHSAILARALEIPAVLSVDRAAEILRNGDTVIIDGGSGEVIVSPDSAQMENYKERQHRFIRDKKELEIFRGRSTVSASGETYELFCNIGKPEDALDAMSFDGEGVGLFRTEFLFMDRLTAPTEDEQFEAYKRAALTLGEKHLIIRTLDIGGDKDIPCLGLTQEDNPFMGLRAIRYCLKNRDIFKTQLRAILRASTSGNISIMLPLITCIEELRESRRLIEEIKGELRSSHIKFNENIRLGIMVETASAAVIADVLAKEADFFSIGSNDLTGYTMACDRGNVDVSYLYSVLQPSVLRMIKRIILCAKENNIPVAMCGEAAADPMMIPLLISFGLTEFSVSPPAVLKVRKYISGWTKQKADKIAEKAMSLETQSEIYEYLKTVIL